MQRTRTLMLILSVIVLFAATPIMAELAGTWQGKGAGNTYPPGHGAIYPWQNWKGEIPKSQDVFSGEWSDASGNHGTFKGKIYFPPIKEEAIAEGEWTWFDPLGPSAEPIVGGKFKMTFYFLQGECKGTWSTIWISSSARGTMKGYRVP